MIGPWRTWRSPGLADACLRVVEARFAARRPLFVSSKKTPGIPVTRYDKGRSCMHACKNAWP
jgi:hypothetical protein